MLDAQTTPRHRNNSPTHLCTSLLRNLCPRDAEAIAARGDDMKTALIVRKSAAAPSIKIGRAVVQLAESQGWVTRVDGEALASYTITRQGRDVIGKNKAHDWAILKLSKPNATRGGPAAFLAPDQVNAAFRLFEDYELAALEVLGAVDWEKVAKGTSIFCGNDARNLPDANRRAFAALRFLGPDLADITLAVVCQRQGLEDAERALGWPSRSGKLVLRIALTRLADHYRVAA